MKFYCLLFFFIPATMSAQDCALKKTKDPYTKEVKISTGFIQLQGASVSIEATKSEIDFLFSLGPNKCFDDGSTAAITYEGSRTKTNLKNGGTMNCDGLFHFNFRNVTMTPYALQNLAQKKISAIRFKDNSKTETEVTVTPEQQKQLMDLTMCIINESKTLIPQQ
jgi:hypothetical protein